MYRVLFYLALTLALDSKPTEVVTSLYVAPTLQFKLMSGTVLPHDVIMCDQGEDKKTFGDHTDNYAILKCDKGVVLQLDHIQFGTGHIAVKIESIHGGE
jgi:hypothetical protein